MDKPDNPLHEVQNVFCLIDLEGSRYVLDRRQIHESLNGEGNHPIHYYKKPEGNLSIERFLEASDLPLTSRDVKRLLADFYRSPLTLEYKGVAFDPEEKSETVLNFWRPHAVVPVKGNYEIIADFMFEVLCAGSESDYQWLEKFLAHMIQKPWEKPEVAIILLGGQGVGKGMFYRLLKRVWPYTVLQVHDVDEVVGHFNGGLERNYGVWLDEALFTHDRKSMGKLKAVISEEELRINEKFQPRRTIKSHHRIFAASNNEHFGNIAVKDRRFFILGVSDCHQQDHDYFKQYVGALEDGTSVPAFVHALLNKDITSFNVRERPQTKEHGEQKIKSLTGIERFFHEVLAAGELPSGHLMRSKIWNGSMRIATADLRSIYIDVDRNAEKFRTVLNRDITTAVKKMCPSAKPVRWQEDNKQCRGLVLPSLEDAQKEFDAWIGFPVPWEDC